MPPTKNAASSPSHGSMSFLKLIGASDSRRPFSIRSFSLSPASPPPGNLDRIESIACFWSPSGARLASAYMTEPAGTSSEAPEAASSLSPQAAKLTGRTRTAMVRSSLRIWPRNRGERIGALELERVRAHAPGAMCLDQRQAEGEVLDREPRGVEQRNPIRSGTPWMGAGQDGAELGHVVAAHEPGLDRTGQLAAVARLGPLVAEELAGRDGLGLGLRLARPVRAQHVEMHARPEVVPPHDRLVAGRDAGDDVARERVLARTSLPAELAGELPGGLGIGVEADA